MPTTRAELLEKEKLDRYATLTAGMYAWVHGKPGICAQAGSGVFGAPGIVLTAKHVVNGMGTLDPRWNPDRHQRQDFASPNFDIRLYQVPRFGQPVLWYARGSIARSKDTDIAVLTVAPDPDSPMATWAAQHALTEAFVPWRLEPPREGETVELYGFPKPQIESTGEVHTGPIQWVQQTAVVADVYPKMRTHGHLDFPCFRLDKPVDSSFSGGPVFCKGALAGITSVSLEVEEGSDIPRDTYVASLWPLLLRDFEYNERKVTFGDLFDEGVIRVLDYPRFRGKVSRRACEQCLIDDENHMGHVEWSGRYV